MKFFLKSSTILILCGLWMLACTPPMNPKSSESGTASQAGDQSSSAGQTSTELPTIAGQMNDTQAGNANADTTCQPHCVEGTCGDDGCGGTCGPCTNGQVCQGEQCVNAESCDMTCESENAQCGMVCGTSCGTCAAQHDCEQGQCICQPDCRNKTCGADNGCGGICEPCPRTQNCDSCVLQLKLIAEEATQGRVHTVRVELQVQLEEGAPKPQMADLRLQVKGPAVLGRVGLSDALINAQKSLVPDAQTGLPYRRSPAAEGEQGDLYAFTILSTQNRQEIAGGSWLVFEFQIGDTRAQPVEISLVKREQIFAPIQADSLLWGDEFNQSLVIWPTLEAGETP